MTRSAALRWQVASPTSLPGCNGSVLVTILMRADILYAPNVHTGGGIVLLEDFLATWPVGKPLHAFLDARAMGRLMPSTVVEVTWVTPCLIDRLHAEFLARRAAGQEAVTMFCFHGLPPLFVFPGNVVVFVQNRLLIEQGSLADYPLRVRVRLSIERLWCRALQGRCSRYIVQTPSMAALLGHWLKSEVPVSVMPFIPSVHSDSTLNPDTLGQKFDFVYVASGERHKNHRSLLHAWRLLGTAGFTPSLALTVDAAQYPTLSAEIAKHADEMGLNIVNLGQMASVEINSLYLSSTALIFPSQVESFGLPLIEASRLGLPILASELDYVRDVVQPVETFDPNSPISIARAVRRFLENPDPVAQLHTAKEFFAEIFK